MHLRKPKPFYAQILCKFRRLPTPLLVMAVLSRFVFGLGVGELLAVSMRRVNWKLVGGVTLGVGLALVVPAGVKVWRE